jgi:hypothetical protein
MRDRRSAYKFVGGETERKRQIGRPGCRLENNIKMDLQETE